MFVFLSPQQTFMFDAGQGDIYEDHLKNAAKLTNNEDVLKKEMNF